MPVGGDNVFIRFVQKHSCTIVVSAAVFSFGTIALLSKRQVT